MDDDTAARDVTQDPRPRACDMAAPSPGSVLTVLDGPGIGAEPFQPVIQSVQGHRGVRGARVPPESSQSPATHLPPGSMPCRPREVPSVS